MVRLEGTAIIRQEGGCRKGGLTHRKGGAIIR